MKKLLLVLCAWIAMVGMAFGTINVDSPERRSSSIR